MVLFLSLSLSMLMLMLILLASGIMDVKDFQEIGPKIGRLIADDYERKEHSFSQSKSPSN